MMTQRPQIHKLFDEIINTEPFTKTINLNEEIIDQGLVQYFYGNDDKSAKDIIKVYKVGYASKYTKLIKMFLNKWIPNLKDKLDENSEIFDKKTSKVLLLFNKRFGIKAKENEITLDHLKIFKDIFNNELNTKKYPIEDKFQKTTYELFRKYGADKAVAKLEYKPKLNHARKTLASRSGFLFNNFTESKKIMSTWGVKQEIADVFVSLKKYLAQYGYKLVISCGSGGKHISGSAHYSGDALDFEVHKKGNISKQESKTVEKLIIEFREQNNEGFIYHNEYTWHSPDWKGEHFHIAKY